jgi:hypothetical protein
MTCPIQYCMYILSLTFVKKVFLVLQSRKGVETEVGTGAVKFFHAGAVASS